MRTLIEEELIKLAQCDTVIDALRKLSIVPWGCASAAVEEQHGWHRSGSETYLCLFRVHFEDRVLPLVLKACVAYSPSAASVEEILERWVGRRQIISANYIHTPHLYGWGNGLVLEEYVPHSLMDILAKTSSSKEFLAELGRLIGVLSKLGFSPIRLLDDLRSRGEDVVLTDFGEDLGDPTESPYPFNFDTFATWARERLKQVSESDLNVARVAFFHAIG